MVTLPLAPLWILEYLVALVVLILNILSLRLSRRLVAQDPENALWLFFNWLAIAFLIFAVTHLMSHALMISSLIGTCPTWRWCSGFSAASIP